MRRIGLTLLALTGCGEGDPDGLDPSGTADPGSVTWRADIGPLLAERCTMCHRDGGIAPFSLETYDSAVPWSAAVLQAVETETMPPFDARITDECTPDVWFKDDHRLDDAEVAQVRAWVEAGSPEGTGALEQGDRAAFDLEDPDEVLPLVAPYTVDGDRDIYRCFRIELPHDQDMWVTGMQVLPDNNAIVHHVLVWTDPEDQSADAIDGGGSYACSGDPGFFPAQLVGGWAPGASPMRTPPDTGTLVKAGSSLVVNVHYHPTGEGAEVDQSAIALEWTDEEPSNYATWYLVDLPFGAEVMPGPDDRGGPEFRIPAGATAHVETLEFGLFGLLPISIPVFGIMPHMHYLGTDMRVRILPRTGPEACLVHTPAYRFDYQTTYFYDAPVDDLPTLKSGGTIEVRCTYNNSPSNPFFDDALEAAGRDQPADVGWGEETGDEMCMAVVGLILPPIDLGI